MVLGQTPGEAPAPLSISNQSFHPNEEGTSLYSDTLTRALRAIGM